MIGIIAGSNRPASTTVILFLPMLRGLSLSSYNEYPMPNAAARVTSDTGEFDRGLMQLLLEKLHWLDVRERVTF